MKKKFKVRLFFHFESDCFNVQQEVRDESGDENEQYYFDSKEKDELGVYLNLEIDKSMLSVNPLLS